MELQVERMEGAPLQLPAFDLSYLPGQILKDHPEMTSKQVDDCIAQYLSYLALCKAYPDEPLMPSREADTAWHQHILNTRRYHADCMTYFGQYLHHNPRMPTTKTALRSRQLFVAHFGGDPKAELVMCGCSDGCDQSFDPSPESQIQ